MQKILKDIIIYKNIDESAAGLTVGEFAYMYTVCFWFQCKISTNQDTET